MNIKKLKLKKLIAVLSMVLLLAVIACTPTSLPNGPIDSNGPPSTEPIIFGIFFIGVDNPIEPIRGQEGITLHAPIPPTRDGFRFDGWFEDDVLFDFDEMPARDVILEARFSQIFTITFSTGVEDLEVESLLVANGDTISENQLPTPIRSLYIFDGWLLGGATYTGGIVRGNINLIARWRRGISIAFDTLVEGLYVQPITAEPGSRIFPPTPPIRPGYGFGRWERFINNAWQNFNFTTMPNQTIELRARWERHSTLPAVFIDIVSHTQSNPNGGLPSATGSAPMVAPGVTIPITSVQNPNFNFGNSSWIRSYIRVENAGEYNLARTEFDLRGRGSGSWTEFKKGYRIRFDNPVSNHQSMLGMPTNRNWVLVSGANFNDRTMVGNHTAYTMAREIFDGMYYSPRSRMVDVFFNGVYHGVYMLTEQARAVPDRVPIVAHLDAQRLAGLQADNFYAYKYSAFFLEYCVRANGSNMPGGARAPSPEDYEWFGGSSSTAPLEVVPSAQRVVSHFGRYRHGFNIISPDASNRSETGRNFRPAVWEAQRQYIRYHISNLSVAIFSGNWEEFSRLAYVPSFVDMYILHELFKNTDTGWSSLFMYRTAGPNGRIHMGPPWDFDATLGRNRTYNSGDSHYNGLYVADSRRASASPAATFSEKFYVLARHTPQFMALVNQRWQEISSDVQVFVNRHLSDAFITEHRLAFGRDLFHWGAHGPSLELGIRTAGIRPGFSGYASIEVGATHWEGYVRSTRTWLINRIGWLNNFWRV
ncbi:MAG: CotH kinase family protein [Firmicutes bacterium]|nr:CotH kinase family protein [Bacillota bacterium]